MKCAPEKYSKEVTSLLLVNQWHLVDTSHNLNVPTYLLSVMF